MRKNAINATKINKRDKTTAATIFNTVTMTLGLLFALESAEVPGTVVVVTSAMSPEVSLPSKFARNTAHAPRVTVPAGLKAFVPVP